MMHTHDHRLLAQADLLLLAADLLHRPDQIAAGAVDIDADTLETLLAGAGWSDRPALRGAIGAAITEACQVEHVTWAAEHARLFDAETLCPANESAFVRRDKGAILADLAGFYAAFGFEHEQASAEKCDHLRTQLHFAAVLLVMLDRSRRQGDDDAAEVVAAALVKFHADHAGLWLGMFCDQLEATTTLALYAQVAEVLRRIWQAVGESHDLPAAVVEGAVEAYEPTTATPYECGMAAAESGAGRTPVTLGGAALRAGGAKTDKMTS